MPFTLSVLLHRAVLPCTLIGAPASSPASPPRRLQADSAHATDTAGVIRRLPNGVTYYVRRNAQSLGRVDLRLVVRAGSLNEADDQRGAATLIALTALQGTAHFSADSISEYVSHAGGSDSVVRVGYVATIYHIAVDADSAAIERGLALLADWARGISVTASTLETAHVLAVSHMLGVEEHAIPADVSVDSVRFTGTRAAARPPLGTEATLDARTPAQLNQFVQTWYRPDNMAIMVNGDLAPQLGAKLLAARFTGLPAARTPLPIPSSGTAALSDRHDAVVAVLTDSGASAPSVRVLYPVASSDVVSDPAYGMLLNQRLGAAVGRLSEYVSWSTTRILVGQPEGGAVAEIRVQTRGGGAAIDSAIAAVVTEVMRAGQYGFAPAEVALAQRLIRASSDDPARQTAQDVLRFVLGDADRSQSGPRKEASDRVTSAGLHTRAAQWSRVHPLVVVWLPRANAPHPVTPAALAQTITAAARRRAAPIAVDTALGIVSVTPGRGVSVDAILRREAAHAVQVGRIPVLETGATWCGPCHLLADLLNDPRMRGMLQSMYVIHVDVDKVPLGSEWVTGLPAFAGIGRDGKATGLFGGGLDQEDIDFAARTSVSGDDWTTEFASSTMPGLADCFAKYRIAFAHPRPYARRKID